MKKSILQPMIADESVIVQFTDTVVFDKAIAVTVSNGYTAYVFADEKAQFRIEPCSEKKIVSYGKELLGKNGRIAFVRTKPLPPMAWGFGNIQVNNERLKEAYRVGANGKYATELSQPTKMIACFPAGEDITVDALRERTISAVKNIGVSLLGTYFAGTEISVFEIASCMNDFRAKFLKALQAEPVFTDMGLTVKDLTVEGTITSYTTAGGIAGYMGDVTLSGHIVSNVRIQAPNVTESYETGMGGISGEVENCSLEDGTVLENKGAITGPTAGGLFGYAHTDLNNLENSTFINSGDITGVNESATAKNVYAGGFIGRIEATSAEGFTFPAGSNSTGTVSASAWGSEMEAWAGWKIGHAAELDDMSSVEATQKANEGYTGAPAVTASNPDGGSVYVNGAKE